MNNNNNNNNNRRYAQPPLQQIPTRFVTFTPQLHHLTRRWRTSKIPTFIDCAMPFNLQYKAAYSFPLEREHGVRLVTWTYRLLPR